MFADMILTSQPRGLHNFISEIRSVKSKEEERIRVDKELGNIRSKFATSSNLSSYQKKKYVWKMCYIYMLGYDVDFGHVEFISLMSSTKFQEKSVGYMALAMMVRPGDELMTLVINSMRNDIVGHFHPGQTLALAAVANIGGNDLAEALTADVQRLIVPPFESNNAYHNIAIPAEVEANNKALSCKKASLCLLRLFRTNPECIELEEWMKRLARLLEDRDLGVITSVMSFALATASYAPAKFEQLVPYVVSILTRLAVNRTCSHDYLYYRIPCPWLQVKCLRFLQYYKIPDSSQMELLNDVLSKILVKTDSSESNNKNNADHSILFEAINLVISYGPDAPSFLKEHSCALLGRFIALKDANIRYLSLDAMTRLAKLDGAEAVQMHQATVLESLKDADISVRKRALNLLYVLTDYKNAKLIVGELVLNLSSADSAIKDDMVVKIALLTEKYTGSDYEWYVNTMLQVILVAGDFVAEAVWYRIVQVVTNHSEIHEYAAEKLLQSVQSKWAHETIVGMAGYLLGEIGVNIYEKPGMSGYDQFSALHQHFGNCSTKVQAILLTCYMKLLNLYPEQTRDLITDVFVKYSTSSQLEVQQRSCEYLAMPSLSREIMENVLNPMPPYDIEEKENVLLTLNVNEKSATGAATDRSVWNVDQNEKDASRNAYIQSRKSISQQSTVTETSGSAPIPPRPTQPAPLMDLLSLDDDEPSSSASFSEVGNEEQTLSADTSKIIKDLFNAATIAKPNELAVLLETQLIKVCLLADYRAHQGRLSLVLENKSYQSWNDLKVVIPTHAALKIQLQNVPSSMEGNDETRMQIAVECMRPFADSPQLEISFVKQGRDFKYTFPLPITAVSFMEPISADKTTYMARWKSIEGPNTEAQEIFTAAKPVNPSLIKYIRNELFPIMKLGIAEGLDNEKTVTGSCSFRTGTVGADGQLAAVGAMVRLEADPAQNKFRVTIRAKHAIIASALKTFIIDQLSS